VRERGGKVFTDYSVVNRISKKWEKIALCTNPQIILKIHINFSDSAKKVIHIAENVFMGKIELFTKLFTLSTKN
jgi:hypothetical protein